MSENQFEVPQLEVGLDEDLFEFGENFDFTYGVAEKLDDGRYQLNIYMNHNGETEFTFSTYIVDKVEIQSIRSLLISDPRLFAKVLLDNGYLFNKAEFTNDADEVVSLNNITVNAEGFVTSGSIEELQNKQLTIKFDLDLSMNIRLDDSVQAFLYEDSFENVCRRMGLLKES